MKVLKFGGSSLGSSERIQNVATTISQSGSKHIVVSAINGTTDELFEIAELARTGDEAFRERLEELKAHHLEIVDKLGLSSKDTLSRHFEELASLYHGISLLRETTPRILDLLTSFGERMSATLLSEYLKKSFQHVLYVDTRNYIKSDDHFGEAKVLRNQTYDNLRTLLRENKDAVCIYTGYIASTEKGETTTLGRGGSDLTAALLAAAYGASEIQIWTDVDGVLTADPSKVKKAFPIEQLSFEEALELSHFGAKVIHPPSLKPAIDCDIPVRIKNTFRPEFPGTFISRKKSPVEAPITGISSIDQIALLRVTGAGMIGVAGISKRLFSALYSHNVNVILISQASSEHSICIAIDPESAERAREAVESEFELEIQAQLIESVSIEEGFSILAVVGENMAHAPGLSARLFQALGRNGINAVAIAQGSTELNISVVISSEDETKALRAVHDAFFFSEVHTTLNLYLVGTGRVGKTLLKQLLEEKEALASRRLELRIVGLANSKAMFFEPSGITNPEEALQSGEPMPSVSAFVDRMQELNLANSVFIDCTASAKVAEVYKRILRSSISIVTPNKRANSGSYESYCDLLETAQRNNVKYYYETNVGAGLPIISTLQDLLASGDKVTRIEAVLSGTLSYIFNTFASGKSFSGVVKLAHENGFTEPDPREDLNGQDVARKLLILAREIGLPLENSSLKVQSLIPACTESAKTAEEFLNLLPDADGEFERLLSEAESEEKVLRYIGRVENGRAEVSLQAVDQSHPFYSLSGTDNIISFTTHRYQDTPLVVKGPGAGTDVTAAGVFAEIVRIASYQL